MTMLKRVQIGGWSLLKVQQTIDHIVSAINSTIAGRVKVTSADDQENYLDSKVAPGRGLTRTVLNPGAIEQYQLDAVGAEHELIVDPSGDFDDTSISSAITTAIAGGASASDPWLVTVKPGVYTEPPMNIPPGVAVVSKANRIDTVFVVADNAGADLFTCSGGYLAGLSLSGVTDASHALVRCGTASSLVVMHGLSWRNCSTGILVENGASAIMTNSSVNITGAGQAVDDAIICRDADSFLGITGIFISVPTAVLALYPGVNPIQRGVTVSGAEATISNAVIHIDYNVADNDGILADDGAFVLLFSLDVEDCYYATRIGPNGADTKMIIQGASFFNNDLNGRSDSATGLYQVSAEASAIKFSAVAGARLNGLIQVSGDGETLIAGDAGYLYSSLKQTNFGDFIHDVTATGYTDGGEVTDAGGLDVDVDAGEGYSTRHAPDHDTETITWDAVSGVTLADDSTNYVIYDPVSESITSLVAAPGADKIELSTVITESGDIIYLHDTRQDVHQPTQSLHDYLLDTRRIAWISGLATSQGTANANLDVDAGSWYRAWETLSVAGGSDITWAYYYGSGGGLTRVAGVSAVDVLQYDNAGVLTAWTGPNLFKADTLIVTSDNRFTMIYGTQEFATQALAEDAANKAAIPNFLDPTGCHVSLVVSGSGAAPPGTASVVSRIDIRPNPNAATAGGGGGAAPTAHSGLTGLGADDHTQYLRTDGTRILTGTQSFGGNNVTNVGTVNGVTVEGHQARHRVGGPDALPVATSVLSGLMSATDKAILDGISPSYAEIYLSASDSQVGLGASPVTLSTFDSDGVDVDSTADEANNRITIGSNGNYKVSFNIAFTGQNNATYTFQAYVNGVAQTNGIVFRKMGVGGDVGACGFDSLISMTAGQQLTIGVTTTGVNITAEACVLNAVKM